MRVLSRVAAACSALILVVAVAGCGSDPKSSAAPAKQLSLPAEKITKKTTEQSAGPDGSTIVLYYLLFANGTSQSVSRTTYDEAKTDDEYDPATSELTNPDGETITPSNDGEVVNNDTNSNPDDNSSSEGDSSSSSDSGDGE